jgi:hypothetical protein
MVFFGLKGGKKTLIFHDLAHGPFHPGGASVWVIAASHCLKVVTTGRSSSRSGVTR